MTTHFTLDGLPEMILIRSNRRSIEIGISNKGVIIRAPFVAPISEIENLVREKKDWIIRQMNATEAQMREIAANGIITMDEVRELADKALKIIPERVAHYAPMIGVQPRRIGIRNQTRKWGSCSGARNLNFNCLLMLTPLEVVDSIVVHELCHLKEPNHSDQFYAEVLRVFPDYWKWNAWLKEHGASLIMRMEMGFRQ